MYTYKLYAAVQDETVHALARYYNNKKEITPQQYEDLKKNILCKDMRDIILCHGKYFYNSSSTIHATPPKLRNLLTLYIENKVKNKQVNSKTKTDNFVGIKIISSKWSDLFQTMKHDAKNFDTICLKYSIYVITNAFEDVVNVEVSSLLKNGIPLIKNVKAPDYIIDMIISYKESIVLMDVDDSDNSDKSVIFDTYGKYMDFYPKLLNWNFDDMTQTCHTMIKSGNKNVLIWVKYFSSKERYHSIGSQKKISNNFDQFNQIFQQRLKNQRERGNMAINF